MLCEELCGGEGFAAQRSMTQSEVMHEVVQVGRKENAQCRAFTAPLPHTMRHVLNTCQNRGHEVELYVYA